MPGIDVSRIRSLSPAALRIFKEQAQQKAQRGDLTYARLVSMPELADIFGKGQLPTKRTEASPLKTAVSYATTPLRWIEQNVTRPFGAVVTSPFTPSVPGTEGMGFLQRERAEYEQWEEPEFIMPWGGKFRPTKGAVESLPWLALPSAGAVAGKLGAIAKTGGAVGKAAQVGAKALAPAVAVEALPGKVVGKVAEKVLPKKEVTKIKLDVLTETEADYLNGTMHGMYHNYKAGEPITGTIETYLDEMSGRVLTPKRKAEIAIERKADKLRDKIDRLDERIEVAEEAGKNTKILEKQRQLLEDEIQRLEDEIEVLQPKLASVAAAEALPGKVVGGVINKLTGVLRQAEKVLPEQKILHSEALAAKQAKAMEKLSKGKGEQAYIDYVRELQGALPNVSFEPVGKKLLQQEWDEIFDFAKSNPLVTGFDFATINTAITKIKKGILPFESELMVLEKAYGKDLVGELVKKMPPSRFNQALDIANAPRTALASFDMSYPWRQGMLLWARHPIEQFKTIKPMIKAFFSDANAEVVDQVIMGRANTAKALSHGIEFTPIPSKTSLSIGGREEMFASRVIEKIPFFGQIVRASNRAYVTAANDTRSRAWEIAYPEFVKYGAEKADLDGLGRFIMAASGRGNLPKVLEGAGPLLNATFFAPKLLWSRFEVLANLASSSPLVRKEAAKTLASFLGMGTTLLGIASMGGATVEKNPMSSDFGKLKVSDTRLDIWAGYSQWVRFADQIVMGQRKTTGGEFKDISRKEVWERLWESKSSPALGLLIDILRGESYMGEEISLKTEDLRELAARKLAPLFIQDMTDALLQQGAGGLIAFPGFFGVGVTTYMNPVQKMREEIASKKYGMSWEEVGKTMGNVAQRQLENENPQLTQLAEQEQERYSKSIAGKADPNNRYRIEVGLIEDSYAKNIELATQEFRDKGDGTAYREKINNIAMNRREQYNLVNMNPDYSQVVDYYKKPLDEKRMARMSPQDIARRAYNDLLYGDDMYDQYGNYRFEMIDPLRTAFSQQYGLDMLAYVEEYQNVKAKDMPPEYEMLKQAQGILRPYFEIETQIWSQYPPELEQAAKQIKIIGRTDKRKERELLARYPQIVYIRKIIAYEQKRMKMQNPAMKNALAMFYSY